MPLQHQSGCHPLFEFPLARSSLLPLYTGKFHSRRENHLKTHFLFGSAAWPFSQLLNASLEGENESSSESYTSFQFFYIFVWGFFLVMNLCIHVFLQRTAQLLPASQYCHDVFIHFVVSGATGVLWKTEAGFPCSNSFLWTCFSTCV